MEMESQLKEAQAKLEALKKSREEVAKKRELERTLRALADEEVIAQLEDQHGPDNLRILDTDKGAIVVGRPDAGEYKRITAKADNINLVVATTYAKTCVLHPPKAELDALIEQYPALAWPIMNAANSIAAAAAKARQGE